jgi:hypothetical protein
MGWLSFKAQYAIASGNMEIMTKPLFADDCPYTFNATSSAANFMETPSEDYIFPLYKISYMWYTFFAAMFTIIVSILCSALIFGFNDPKTISPELLAPAIRKRIFKKTTPEVKSRSAAEIKDTVV